MIRHHHLKLYAEDENGPQSSKKPVVIETYNEIVFPDPSEDFYTRIEKNPAVIVPRLPVTFNLPSGNVSLCPLLQTLPGIARISSYFIDTLSTSRRFK